MKNKFSLFIQYVEDRIILQKAKFVCKTLNLLKKENAYKNAGFVAMCGLLVGPTFRQIGKTLPSAEMYGTGNFLLGMSVATILFLTLSKKYFYRSVEPKSLEKRVENYQEREERVKIYQEMDKLHKVAVKTRQNLTPVTAGTKIKIKML